MTAAKFEPLIFSVWGLALSNVANIFIFMILDDFCRTVSKTITYIYIYIYTHTHIITGEYVVCLFACSLRHDAVSMSLLCGFSVKDHAIRHSTSLMPKVHLNSTYKFSSYVTKSHCFPSTTTSLLMLPRKMTATYSENHARSINALEGGGIQIVNNFL
jgi:hypothetical protein